MKQVKLRKGRTEQISWVDEHPKLREGVFISFKNSVERWRVIRIWDLSLEKRLLYKTWKVGGLV